MQLNCLKGATCVHFCGSHPGFVNHFRCGLSVVFTLISFRGQKISSTPSLVSLSCLIQNFRRVSLYFSYGDWLKVFFYCACAHRHYAIDSVSFFVNRTFVNRDVGNLPGDLVEIPFDG